MPIPFIARQASRFDRGEGANYRKSRHSVFDWRCTRCDKLLGVCKDGQLHLRFSQGHEYFVGFPATAICRGCQTLNKLTAAPVAGQPAPRHLNPPSSTPEAHDALTWPR